MDNYELYSLGLLPAHSERFLPFANNKTITECKRGNCYPFAGNKRSISSYIVPFGKVYSEETYTSTSIGCMKCLSDVIIFANYSFNGKSESFKKETHPYFDFPSELTLTISKP